MVEDVLAVPKAVEWMVLDGGRGWARRGRRGRGGVGGQHDLLAVGAADLLPEVLDAHRHQVAAMAALEIHRCHRCCPLRSPRRNSAPERPACPAGFT